MPYVLTVRNTEVYTRLGHWVPALITLALTWYCQYFVPVVRGLCSDPEVGYVRPGPNIYEHFFRSYS